MQVDIFLITSSKTSGKIKRAGYKYILVCKNRTCEGSGELINTTGHRLVMTCAIEALKRMTKASMITIHTDCRYLINNKMQEWKDAGWKRQGGELKNADLWRQLYELQKPHAVRYHFENMDIFR